MNNNIKIGIISPFDFLNLYGGESQRLKADLSALTQLGINIDVIFPTKTKLSTLKQNEFKENINLKTYLNFQKICFLPEKARLILDKYSQTFNPFFGKALRKSSKDCQFLIVHFPLILLISHFIMNRRIPILYAAHNFEYGLSKQTVRNSLYHKVIYYLEKNECLKAAKVLCVSEKDKHDLQEAYHIPPEKIWVFPNTVDTAYFEQTRVLYEKTLERRRLGIDPQSFILIFSGRMDYRPNVEALKFIVDELTPTLEQTHYNFHVLVVGAQIPASYLTLKKQTVSFYTDVPDMRRFYAIADAAIIPLVSGGGTRIKILESFASKLPVISSEIGCEGINCKDGKDILIAKVDAQDFENKARLLLNDSKMREHIITNAYELVTRKYSTKAARIYFKELITELLNK